MRNVVVMLLLAGTIAAPLFAGVAPEIDSYSATAAIGLVGGAVLLIRSRRKK